MKKDSKLKSCNSFISKIKRNGIFIALFAVMSLGISETAYANTDKKKIQTPELSLKVVNTTIINLFAQIERQSGFPAIYAEELKEALKHRVSITVYRTPVEAILDTAFEGTELAYEIKEGKIYITKAKEGAKSAQPAAK